MAARIPGWIPLVAGLGLVGAAVILETLEQRLPDLPAARPAREPPKGPPPTGVFAMAWGALLARDQESPGGSQEGAGDDSIPIVDEEKEPTCRIRGSAVDENGDPVTHVALDSMTFGCTMIPLGEGKGARDGSFEFLVEFVPGPGDREYFFDVRASGYVPVRVTGTERDWSEIVADRSLEGIRVTLRRAATVRGVVLSRDGSPLAGVHLSARWDSIGSPGRSEFVETRRDGRFSLSQIDPYTPALLEAEWYGDPVVERRVVVLGGRLEPGGTHHEEIVMESARDVSLVIRLQGDQGDHSVYLDGEFVGDFPPDGILLCTSQPGEHDILIRGLAGKKDLEDRLWVSADDSLVVLELAMESEAPAADLDGEEGTDVDFPEGDDNAARRIHDGYRGHRPEDPPPPDTGGGAPAAPDPNGGPTPTPPTTDDP